jgi:hypothetical protein
MMHIQFNTIYRYSELDRMFKFGYSETPAGPAHGKKIYTIILFRK